MNADTAVLKERLDGTSAVKGTMLRAHLAWAADQHGLTVDRLRAAAEPAVAGLLSRTVLPTDWLLFRTLIAIDRLIAKLVSAPEDETFLELGRYSAILNLKGVYKTFISSEPHRFFERMTVLHRQFESFGVSAYERTGEKSGQICIAESPVYSPVHCLSGQGYYEGSLRLMHGDAVSVRESRCRCRGDETCLFWLAW